MEKEIVRIFDVDFRLYHVTIGKQKFCVAEENLDNLINKHIDSDNYSMVQHIDEKYVYVIPQAIADTENESTIVSYLQSNILIDERISAHEDFIKYARKRSVESKGTDYEWDFDKLYPTPMDIVWFIDFITYNKNKRLSIDKPETWDELIDWFENEPNQ